MRLTALAAFALGAATMAGAQTQAQWDYLGKNGPLNWGKLNPAYRACSKGHEQSPIDIRGARLNKGLKPIEFHYIAGPVTLENDGHTVVVHVDPGSYMIANGVRYNLLEFDFHHPGEMAVRGKLSDMDIDLVHQSADGKMAVIEVRLRESLDFPNATLATLFADLPTKRGQTERIKDMVNPGGLLPGDRGYWTFMGSLATPPCTEGVRWFVFEDSVSISRTQLRAFGDIFKIDSRPLQDTHGRRIEADE